MTRWFSLLLALMFLPACGIKGELATPAPLFGEPDAVLVEPELAEDVEADGEEDPEPFYGPEFEDPIAGRDE